MRFLFTSIRGQGHTRPLLPFAKALQASGHEVAIASPEDTRAITDKAGIDLLPFDRMTDEDIQAFWKSQVEELPTSEIAEELDMTPAAVRKSKYRVLQRLREEFDGLLD